MGDINSSSDSDACDDGAGCSIIGGESGQTSKSSEFWLNDACTDDSSIDDPCDMHKLGSNWMLKLAILFTDASSSASFLLRF